MWFNIYLNKELCQCNMEDYGTGQVVQGCKLLKACTSKNLFQLQSVRLFTKKVTKKMVEKRITYWIQGKGRETRIEQEQVFVECGCFCRTHKI